MSTIIPFLLAALLIALVLLGWVLTLLGLPGIWLILASAAAYAWLGPAEGVMMIAWSTVAIIGLLCVVGEVAEFLAGMWGANKAGGSRRAAVFALVGSLVGAIAGGTLGLPIPLVGTPLGAIMGGAVGALVGAGLAERSRGESGHKSWQVGHAAFWGRLLGTGVKTLVATVIAVLTIVALML